jgi:hypothetical protein
LETCRKECRERKEGIDSILSAPGAREIYVLSSPDKVVIKVLATRLAAHFHLGRLQAYFIEFLLFFDIVSTQMKRPFYINYYLGEAKEARQTVPSSM